MRLFSFFSLIQARFLAFDRRQLIIVSGFLAVITLTAIVIGIALARMGGITHQLDYVVHNLNARTALIAEVRENVYRRVTSMRDMLLMTDVFAIDEEAQRFYGYGKSIEDKLAGLRELLTDREDLKSLDQFTAPAQEGTRAQNDVIDLLIGGKSASQIRHQLDHAFSAQHEVLENLQQLHVKFEERAHVIVDEALDEYEYTRVLIYVLGALEVSLALVIAVIVSRMLQRQMHVVEKERLKFKTLFESSPDAVLILGGTRIREWNRRALDWFDHKGTASLADLDIESLSPAKQPDGRDSEQVWADNLRIARMYHGGVCEWLFRGRDGNDFHGVISLTPVGTDNDALVQLVIHDDTERWLTERQMQHQATHDMLTGLANRREFEKRLQLAVDNARHEGGEHVLCFLDLDKFKQVNDQGGHAMGDELLKQLAELIKCKIRGHDLLARLGGDEFALVLETCPLDRARKIAEAIRVAIDEYRLVGGGHVFQVGVSIGLAVINSTTASMAQVLAAADAACYAAKHAGRGCVRVANGTDVDN